MNHYCPPWTRNWEDWRTTQISAAQCSNALVYCRMVQCLFIYLSTSSADWTSRSMASIRSSTASIWAEVGGLLHIMLTINNGKYKLCSFYVNWMKEGIPGRHEPPTYRNEPPLYRSEPPWRAFTIHEALPYRNTFLQPLQCNIPC